MKLETVGIVLRNIRQRKRLTLEEVALQVKRPRGQKLSATYLSAIETGRKTNSSITLLEEICRILDTPLPVVFLLSSTEEEISKMECFLPNVREIIKEALYRLSKLR